MEFRTLLAQSLAIATLAISSALPALAKDFPNRQVTLIVPFPPGGGADLLARLLAKKFQEAWGQTVVVMNRPGAAGIIGAKEVGRAEPDGHTLLIAASGAVVPSNAAELAPISLLSAPAQIVAVNSSLPVSNLLELVAYAKARPDGSVSYASSGPASASHLSGELFEALTQTKLTHVPYKGMAQAVQDLIGGQVTVMFGSAPALLPHIKSGELKGLAVTDTHRSPFYNDIPTAGESGVPNFEVQVWYGIFAPANTAPEVIAKIHAETLKVLTATDARDMLASQGATPIGSDPAEFSRFLAADLAKWNALMKKAGAAAPN